MNLFVKTTIASMAMVGMLQADTMLIGVDAGLTIGGARLGVVAGLTGGKARSYNAAGGGASCPSAKPACPSAAPAVNPCAYVCGPCEVIAPPCPCK